MNRRDFLNTVAGAATAGSLGAGELTAQDEQPTASAQVRARRPGTRLGLSLAAYSFRQLLSGDDPEMTLEGFVDYCADHGLEATEPTSYYFRDTSPEYMTRLKRRASVNGLAVSGVPIRCDFCVPAGEPRAEQLAHVRTWLGHAARLGAQTMRVFAGNAKKDLPRDEARSRSIDGLKEAAAVAAEHGVVLAVENHGYLTEKAEDLVGIVRAVGSPWLGVNLDTGNFRTDPYANMEAAAPWAVAVQVKVVTAKPGGGFEPCDFPRVARILRSAGYRGYLALEYESSEDPRVAVPRHLEELRVAIG